MNFVLEIAIGLLFLLFGGLLLKLFAPKDINFIYGYRSSFATKNQATWEEAQKYCSNAFIIAGLALMLLGGFQYFLLRDSSVAEILQWVEVILGVVLIYILTELHLKTIFNEDGSRKIERK